MNRLPLTEDCSVARINKISITLCALLFTTLPFTPMAHASRQAKATPAVSHVTKTADKKKSTTKKISKTSKKNVKKTSKTSRSSSASTPKRTTAATKSRHTTHRRNRTAPTSIAALDVTDNWIVQGDFEPESGYHAMQQILSQSHRPTAVFCGGDIMAMGALCAADEMGLRVPQDVSVIGYDNVRNARYFTPALTTIHQPKDSLGETAFNMLLDRIVNKREESQSIEVHPRLVERRSVADGPFRDYRR
ncbi:hypothetical protein F3Q12_05930 [Salmonella enterica subsp. enterica]|nr:hypothetical protein [Salmonella enterica subsp. enterica]